MTTSARLAFFALTFCVAACGSEPTAAEPAPDEPAAKPQMQMVEADASNADTDSAIELAPASAASAAPAIDVEVAAAPNAEEAPANIRDAALVPEGTPEENAAAFTSMRKSKRDAAPVGGIGPDGIHIDSLVIGRGFSKSKCEESADEFQIGDDARANVCLRVVHGGSNDQQLRVDWKRNGRGPNATMLNLKNGHAYRTRAYLPLRHYSAGEWTVTVSAADGTVLGEGSFTVTK